MFADLKMIYIITITGFHVIADLQVDTGADF